MPMYGGLRIWPRDSAETIARKKRIAGRLRALREALRVHLGEDPDGTSDQRDPRKWMRLATWNIREFPSGKYGSRLDPESYYYIAEILSHFDVIALQEIREDMRALEKVMRILGEHSWSYLATDVTEGSGGNSERMVFVYNTKKAWFRNIAGEAVLEVKDLIAYPHTERLAWSKLNLELPKGTKLQSPANPKTYEYRGQLKLDEDLPIELPAGTKLTLRTGSQIVLPRKRNVELTADGRIVLPTGTNLEFGKDVTLELPKNSIVGDTLQFARTPFMVCLQSGWLKLLLCTVHIYYGSDSDKDKGMARRKAEIRQLTKFLGKRAASEHDSDAGNFFVVLGDFNIVDKEHGTMAALESNGFTVPAALKRVPGSNVDRTKSYDQIAYWSPAETTKKAEALGVTRIEVGRAGVFDFFETVFRRGRFDPEGADEAYYTPIMEQMRAESGSTGKWTYKDWRTFQMSDHLPMWIELRVDFGDDYLTAIEET